MATDVIDYGKTFTDFWTLGGSAWLQAGESAAQTFADFAKKGYSAFDLHGSLSQASVPDLTGEAAELTRASQAMADLWSAANALSATLMGSLGEQLPAATEVDPTIAATYQKLLDPWAWLAPTSEMDKMLSRMAEGPQLADLWEIERKYALVVQAWIVLRRQSLEHSAVELDGWLSAGHAYADDLKVLPKEARRDTKALVSLWIATANSTLVETQRSERFLETQTALIRATTELKVAQRDLVEYYGERFGFPTRTELDDVHRTVTELRREVRAMRRHQDSTEDSGREDLQDALQSKPEGI